MNKAPERYPIDGYVVIDALMSDDEIARIDEELASSPPEVAADRRFLDREWCRLVAQVLRHRLLKRRLLYLASQPVLCTYFGKDLQTDRGEGLHRDLHLPLSARIEGKPWQNWREKQNIPHAQAPSDLLATMVALRINLDDCANDEGGLCVVPGSHLTADVTNTRIECTGGKGSAVAMSPMLLHSSSKSTLGNERRVLQFLFGPRSLPGGAEWYYRG
ncbi:MAG: phytanoyl-CoA dioxygenase family protein [Proteobacteria bacterium]|nr:phytanoyl-CoA dioxygenase family protein [Pseudomonadota bacterium]